MLKVLAEGNGRELFKHDRLSVSILSLTFRFLKSPSCWTGICSAPCKHLCWGRPCPDLTAWDLTLTPGHKISDQNAHLLSVALLMMSDRKQACCAYLVLADHGRSRNTRCVFNNFCSLQIAHHFMRQCLIFKQVCYPLARSQSAQGLRKAACIKPVKINHTQL